MQPLEFLFALLKQFIRFEPGRLSSLQDQAALWKTETIANKDSKVGGLLIKSELWYVQVATACLFLFSVKFVSNWMMSSEDPNLLDEDDEEDEEIPVKSSRKFQLN